MEKGEYRIRKFSLKGGDFRYLGDWGIVSDFAKAHREALDGDCDGYFYKSIKPHSGEPKPYIGALPVVFGRIVSSATVARYDEAKRKAIVPLDGGGELPERPVMATRNGNYVYMGIGGVVCDPENGAVGHIFNRPGSARSMNEVTLRIG